MYVIPVYILLNFFLSLRFFKTLGHILIYLLFSLLGLLLVKSLCYIIPSFFQIKVSLMNGGEEVAFVSVPRYGRGLAVEELAFDTFMASSTNLHLNTTDLFPVFLFTM